MHLNAIIFEYIGWQRSLLRKVGRLTLGHLLPTILFLVFSQVASFLAFFLPLKVILMVATEGIPRYLRFMVSPENKDTAIVLFALGTVVFYLAHLLADHMAEIFSRNGAKRLLEKARKISIFGNEIQMARDFYLRLNRSLVAMLMVVGGFALGLYLNLFVFGALILAVIVEYCAVGLVWRRMQEPGRVNDRLRFQGMLPGILKFISNLNFFIGFAALLVVFLTKPDFGVIRGLLCFILIRQVMQRLLGAIQDGMSLHLNKAKINALFFTHIGYEPAVCQKELSFLEQLRPERRDQWLTDLLRSKGISCTPPWKWLDVSARNVALLYAECDENPGQAVYVKVYESKQDVAFKQEVAALRAFAGASRLLPVLLAELHHANMSMSVLEGPLPVRRESKEVKAALQRSFLELCRIRPDAWLIDQCRRTRPLLPQRITIDKLERLYIGASTPEDLGLVRSLISAHPLISEFLSSLPLVVVNPDLTANNLILGVDGREMLPHWSKWSLEPAGALLPPGTKKSMLSMLLSELVEVRPEFADIPPRILLVCNNIFLLERHINAQALHKALCKIPKFIDTDLDMKNISLSGVLITEKSSSEKIK